MRHASKGCAEMNGNFFQRLGRPGPEDDEHIIGELGWWADEL